MIGMKLQLFSASTLSEFETGSLVILCTTSTDILILQYHFDFAIF
jgi:hypothetical protein